MSFCQLYNICKISIIMKYVRYKIIMKIIINSPLSIARVREQLAGAPASSLLGTSRGMSVGDLLPRHPAEVGFSFRVRDQPNVSRAPTLATEDLPEAAKRVEAALLRLCPKKRRKKKKWNETIEEFSSRGETFSPRETIAQRTWLSLMFSSRGCIDGKWKPWKSWIERNETE